MTDLGVFIFRSSAGAGRNLRATTRFFTRNVKLVAAFTGGTTLLVRKILTALLLPPTGPLLVALLGYLLTRKRPRLGRGLIWAGLLSLFLLSLPVVAYWLQ